jgi:tungstate transport system substrate-binding protein
MKKWILILLLLFSFSLTSCETEKELYIATTTSLENSGLLAYIIPSFEEEYNIKVNIIAVGTGAALELGQLGEVEILLVHDYDSEVLFVENGYGIKRANIMYNDFIIIGPNQLQATSINDAMLEIKDNYNFYSRGDNSGTHVKELSLWQNAGLDVSTFGSFYNETGQGMGDTITMANISSYYTLSDRATYLSMKDNIDLIISYQNSEELLNQYGVIKVNPDLYNKTDEYAELFYNWIQRSDIQTLISTYIMYDEQLFYPNAE